MEAKHVQPDEWEIPELRETLKLNDAASLSSLLTKTHDVIARECEMSRACKIKIWIAEQDIVDGDPKICMSVVCN